MELGTEATGLPGGLPGGGNGGGNGGGPRVAAGPSGAYGSARSPSLPVGQL